MILMTHWLQPAYFHDPVVHQPWCLVVLKDKNSLYRAIYIPIDSESAREKDWHIFNFRWCTKHGAWWCKKSNFVIIGQYTHQSTQNRPAKKTIIFLSDGGITSGGRWFIKISKMKKNKALSYQMASSTHDADVALKSRTNVQFCVQ